MTDITQEAVERLAESLDSMGRDISAETLRELRTALDEAERRLADRPAPVPVPTDIMEARAQGRAEAVAILVSQVEAETGLDDYIRSEPCGASGDWSSSWDVEKLHVLFKANDIGYSLLSAAEGEFWHNMGLREEAEHLAAKRCAELESLRSERDAAIARAEAAENALSETQRILQEMAETDRATTAALVALKEECDRRAAS
jgi:hypothetical protein